MQKEIEQIAAELGIPWSTIYWWRRYRRVAYRHRLRIAEAARTRGIVLTDADFDAFDLVRPPPLRPDRAA